MCWRIVSVRERQWLAGRGYLFRRSLADIEWKANGAPAATPGSGKPITTETLYAHLAEGMKEVGAVTVADLGSAEVGRWEQTLGLHYADKASILNALGRSKKAED